MQEVSTLESSYALNFGNYRILLSRLLKSNLSSFNIPKSDFILDVGCAYGHDLRTLQDLGYQNLFGIEPDSRCLSQTSDLNIKEGSIEAIPFPDASFDTVFVDNVFHHISNYQRAINEISRVLKPNGKLCFIEPRNSLLRQGMDFLTFKTLLPVLSQAVQMRYLVMKEEMDTGLYPLWLASHEKFLEQLRREFKIDWLKKEFFFFRAHVTKLG